MIFDFLASSKYKVYTKTLTSNGAGDNVGWKFKTYINAYIEPVNGENLNGSELGYDKNASLILYSKNIINTGERIFIPENNLSHGGWFEIARREFYKIPFFSYYKGFLVKTDEKLSI